MINIRQRGFSLAEILIVVAIACVLFALSAAAFYSFNNYQALDKDYLMARSMLEDARSKTLAFKNFSIYGVHFDSDQIVLFPGLSYSPTAADNETVRLNSKVGISSVSLNGGGQDVVFSRLTGKTVNNGTIRFSMIGNAMASRTLHIYQTGLIE